MGLKSLEMFMWIIGIGEERRIYCHEIKEDENKLAHLKLILPTLAEDSHSQPSKSEIGKISGGKQLTLFGGG